MEQDVQKLLEEARMFESLEKHPGWIVICSKIDTMLFDATEKLDSVPPTNVDKVLAAHRDWRAVKQVRETLLLYISDTMKCAAEYIANQKQENIQ